MRPYSLGLRPCVVRAVAGSDGTSAEVAAGVGVSKPFVKPRLRLGRERGPRVPQPHGGGVAAAFTPQPLRALCQQIATDRGGGSARGHGLSGESLPPRRVTGGRGVTDHHDTIFVQMLHPSVGAVERR